MLLTISYKRFITSATLWIKKYLTKILLIKILAIFAKYTALITGSSGGVYLAGSLSKSLLKDTDFLEFRNIFEESKKMDKYLSNIPVFLINEKDLGYMGALEVCKNEII